MAHYFDAEPTVANKLRVVHLTLDDAVLDLTTGAGVFSVDAVDPGTRVLLTEAPMPPDGPVTLADVGCGYGPLAITLARRSPQATVWAVDVNTRALELCQSNAQRAGVADRVRVATPEQVPKDLLLDGFWSNPPIRIGKAHLHGLLMTWFSRLRPGVRAHLVVHKHLGSDSLVKWIVAQGFLAERLISRQGYRVLEVTAPLPEGTVR